jgi:hypothetical protein
MINDATLYAIPPGPLNFITQPDANAVIQWNDRTLTAIAQDPNLNANVPRASRVLALESIAVYDVVRAINDQPGYLVNLEPPAGISVDAAIAGAAERILSYAFRN